MPIYITETGIADKKDGNRSHMIDEYMRAVSDQSNSAVDPAAVRRPSVAAGWGQCCQSGRNGKVLAEFGPHTPPNVCTMP
jgi:hypothetical protein